MPFAPAGTETIHGLPFTVLMFAITAPWTWPAAGALTGTEMLFCLPASAAAYPFWVASTVLALSPAAASFGRASSRTAASRSG